MDFKDQDGTYVDKKQQQQQLQTKSNPIDPSAVRRSYVTMRHADFTWKFVIDEC